MKKSTKVEFNTFVKGLITEASPLNFPANASREEINFELLRDGTRRRRLGFDYEDAHAKIATTLSREQYDRARPVSYKWMEVAGVPGRNFVVVQANNVLYFFDSDKAPLSTTGALGSLTLESYPLATRYSLTSVDGFLVVAAGVDTIAIVSYDNPGFSATYERILVRDLWGVEV